MEKKQEILNEIRGISPLLADLQHINVFSVPEGYFESVSDEVMGNIFGLKIRERTGETGMQAPPEGYFDSLSSRILSKVTAESEDDIVPDFLAGLSRENPYAVPEGYFESFPRRVLSLVGDKQQEKARVVPLFARPLFRYAVAAVVALLLMAGIFFTVSQPGDKNGFAAVNKQTVPIKAALKYNSEKAFQKGLESLSEEQIIAFLQTHGNILDNDQLITNTDVSSMPDPLDYLTDDEVLEKYLMKISDSDALNNN